eukprot:6048175-Lingulodinium_polyedra.AAC.1
MVRATTSRALRNVKRGSPTTPANDCTGSSRPSGPSRLAGPPARSAISRRNPHGAGPSLTQLPGMPL